MKLRRVVIGTMLTGVALAVAALVTAYGLLRASLPGLDGKLDAAIAAPVSIERDALGIPTITAGNRADLAFATGFVHAQDRFFQMDLSRRAAAGELTPLFGAVAAEHDATVRVFEFRRLARQVLEQATPRQRSLLAAYTHGVNAGLAGLRGRPWEYWLLRSPPEAWRAEDSILVVYAMWFDLQYNSLRREILRREIDSRLGGARLAQGWKRVTCFLYPDYSSWEAPNESGAPVDSAAAADAETCAAIPTSAELDLSQASALNSRVGAVDSPGIGSNNWALAGRLTASGGALVANDMHLSLRLPATWYRARLRTGALDLNGVTLPGAPVLVAGSNGSIAWGFTNSYGDWFDLEQRPCESTGGGFRVREVLTPGLCWYAHWLAAVPEATNLQLLEFEQAHSVEDALALAPRIGIPQQNLIVGDRAGHIAWTLAGRIPRASGNSRNDGTSGWRAADEQPQIRDPASGRLWSANALPTDDAAQQRAIGDDETLLGADYDLGARAKQIRDDLFAITHPATPADMLAIQLDDRAIFLERWRGFLSTLLDDAALRGKPERAEFKRLLALWNGRASTDSVSYRLVREFRDRLESTLWQAILTALKIKANGAPAPSRFEEPLWALLKAQPRNMLPSPYSSWREFLLAQLDATIVRAQSDCGRLADCSWGRRNQVHIRHPLSPALPFLSPLIDMPAVELPGDHNMPRVHDRTSFGASERFAVTPGRESEGYLHIAGGQSGHPLSPYYRAGFREWAEGKPLPFLPGPVQHRLVLQPAGSR